MERRPKFKMQNYETFRRKHSRIGDLGFNNELLITKPKIQSRKGFLAEGRASAKSLGCTCTCSLKGRSERRQVVHSEPGGTWKKTRAGGR